MVKRVIVGIVSRRKEGGSFRLVTRPMESGHTYSSNGEVVDNHTIVIAPREGPSRSWKNIVLVHRVDDVIDRNIGSVITDVWEGRRPIETESTVRRPALGKQFELFCEPTRRWDLVATFSEKAVPTRARLSAALPTKNELFHST